MRIFRDMAKIERVIESCKTHEHLTCTRKMIDNFSHMYVKENRKQHNTGKAGYSAHLCSLLDDKLREICKIDPTKHGFSGAVSGYYGEL